MRLTTALLAMAVWASAQVVAGSGYVAFSEHGHELSASPEGLVLHHHKGTLGHHEETLGAHSHSHEAEESTEAADHHDGDDHVDHVIATLDPARSLSSHEHVRQDLFSAYVSPIQGASMLVKRAHARWSWPPPQIPPSRSSSRPILQL